jgi:hypothetical protein
MNPRFPTIPDGYRVVDIEWDNIEMILYDRTRCEAEQSMNNFEAFNVEFKYDWTLGQTPLKPSTANNDKP